MKVTAVDVLHADRYMYVKVSTDEGLVGWGELHPASGTGGTPFLPIAGVRYCAEYLVGKNPLEIERHWQHLFRRCLFRGGADVMSAIGAIDIALWDLKGKAYGKPVYELLGGPTRDKVRLYVHLFATSLEEIAEEARARVEEGFTAVRLYPYPFSFLASGQPEGFRSGPRLEELSFTALQRTAVEWVATVREAVGPDVDIMIDVVNRLTPAEAIAVGRELAPFNLYFFEDPIEPENMDQWRYVAENLPMPVAMGERLYTIFQFRDLLRANGAAYIRPDLALAGGITNVKKIAALAEAEHVGVVPHNPLSAVLTAACVQLDAATHNIPVQEYPYSDNQGVKRDLVEQPIEREGGFLLLPTAPGIGIEVDEEAVKRYPPRPYERPPLLNLDGSLRDY